MKISDGYMARDAFCDMKMLQGRQLGLALAGFGVLTVTPDAMLVRFASADGGSPGMVICVKSVFTAALSAALVWFQRRRSLSGQSLYAAVRAAPVHIGVVTLAQIGIQVGFPLSFLYTEASKALLLIALNPMWAALFGRFLLNDRLATRTVVALVLAIASVLMVFVPSLLSGADAVQNSTAADGIAAAPANATDDESSAAHFATFGGDLISIVTGLALASFLTASRWASMRRPGIPLSLTTPIANSVLALCLLPLFIHDVSQRGMPGAVFWGTLAADGVCLTVALVCIVNGKRPVL